MNPNAKEFVPAHILRKRQEDAQRLTDLTEQIKEIELAEKNEITCKNDNQPPKERKPIDDAPKTEKEETSNENKKPDSDVTNGKTSEKIVSHDLDAYTNPEDYPDDPSLDEAYLLEKGESVCEFNGEKFIIPGDDEYVPPIRAGYDFGNDLDNEDEEVCNAFEEFLENLPN